jgi:hypothetical protein
MQKQDALQFFRLSSPISPIPVIIPAKKEWHMSYLTPKPWFHIPPISIAIQVNFHTNSTDLQESSPLNQLTTLMPNK